MITRHHRSPSVRAACDAARAGGRTRRLRPDDGVLPRGPPVADARRARRQRLRGGEPLREPDAVRADRGPRGLPARSRRRRRRSPRPRASTCCSRRRSTRCTRRRAHDGARRRAHRGPVRREPPGALRRRDHGRGEAVLDRRSVPRVLRPQGRAAARGDPAHDRRPRPAGRGRRVPAGARARRPGDVEPQRLPRRPTSAARRPCSRGALYMASEAVVPRRPARRDAARRGSCSSTPSPARRWCGSTTPRSSTPRRSNRSTTIAGRHAGCARRVRRARLA